MTIDVFPASWTEVPLDALEPDDVDAELDARIAACLGREADDQARADLDRLSVSTGEFTGAGEVPPTVKHQVVFAATEDTAVAVMRGVSRDGAMPCVAEVVQDGIRTAFAEDPETAGIAVGDIVATRTELEAEPDVAAGLRLEIPFEFDGRASGMYLEILYQRDGRALSRLMFASFAEPFDPTGYTVLRDEAASRLALIGS